MPLSSDATQGVVHAEEGMGHHDDKVGLILLPSSA